MSIAGAAIAFATAFTATFVHGRNKPLTNKDLDESREIARLKAAVKLERDRADAIEVLLISERAAFGRLLDDNANLIFQRDEARTAASQPARNRNPLLPAQVQMPQAVQSNPMLYAQGLAAVPSDPGHGTIHRVYEAMAVPANMLEWCNCVPARHDMLRPRAPR